MPGPHTTKKYKSLSFEALKEENKVVMNSPLIS